MVSKPKVMHTFSGMWEDDEDLNIGRQETLEQEKDQRGVREGDFTPTPQTTTNTTSAISQDPRYSGDFWNQQAQSRTESQWNGVYDAVRSVVLGSMGRGMGVSPEKEKQLAINRVFGKGGMLEDFSRSMSTPGIEAGATLGGGTQRLQVMQRKKPPVDRKGGYDLEQWQKDYDFAQIDRTDMQRAVSTYNQQQRSLVQAYTDAATTLIDYIPEILRSGFDQDAIALAEVTARGQINKSNPYYKAPSVSSSNPSVMHTFGGMYDDDEDTVMGEAFTPRDDSGAPPPMDMGGGGFGPGDGTGVSGMDIINEGMIGGEAGAGPGTQVNFPEAEDSPLFNIPDEQPRGTGLTKPKGKWKELKNLDDYAAEVGQIVFYGGQFQQFVDGNWVPLQYQGEEGQAQNAYLWDQALKSVPSQEFGSYRTFYDTKSGLIKVDRDIDSGVLFGLPEGEGQDIFNPSRFFGARYDPDTREYSDPFQLWKNSSREEGGLSNAEIFTPKAHKLQLEREDAASGTTSGNRLPSLGAGLSAEDTYNRLAGMSPPDWWPKDATGNLMVPWPPVQWSQPSPMADPIASFDASTFKQVQDAARQGAFGEGPMKEALGADPFAEGFIFSEDVNGDGISEMFIRDTGGNMRQIAAQPRTPSVSIEDQIADALATNNFARAQDLKRFRDQPSDMERFEAALQFSQRPASSFELANIAAGNMPGGGVPAQSLNRAFSDIVGGYTDPGMLTNRMLNADPELSSNAINAISSAGLGFDVPDTPERFQQAFEVLIQSGYTPASASTALGFSPGDIGRLEAAITPSYQRVGEGDQFLREAFQNAFGEYDFSTLMREGDRPSSIVNSALTTEPDRLSRHEQWLKDQAAKDVSRNMDYETGREASENVFDPNYGGAKFMQTGAPVTQTGGASPSTVQDVFGTRKPELEDVLNYFPETTPQATMGTNLPQTSDQWQKRFDTAGVGGPTSAGTMPGMWEDEDDENLTREQRLAREKQRRGTQAGDFSSTMIPQGARQHSGLIVPSDMYNVMNREPLTSRQPALGASNLPIASMQAQRNMTPGGMAAYQSAAQFAGIPEDEFKYSLQTTNPGGFQSTMKKKTQKRPTYA